MYQCVLEDKLSVKLNFTERSHLEKVMMFWSSRGTKPGKETKIFWFLYFQISSCKERFLGETFKVFSPYGIAVLVWCFSVASNHKARAFLSNSFFLDSSISHRAWESSFFFINKIGATTEDLKCLVYFFARFLPCSPVELEFWALKVHRVAQKEVLYLLPIQWGSRTGADRGAGRLSSSQRCRQSSYTSLKAWQVLILVKVFHH